MAILKVAQMGNPVLRGEAKLIPADKIKSPEVQIIIDNMIDTMREYTGVGLAAPQVHEPLRIVALEAEGNPRYEDMPEIPLTVLINPQITEFSPEMEEDWEGCLSLADIWGLVKRSKAVTVTAFGRDGDPVEIRAEGFLARVLQHEIDHLHGKLFVDRMSQLNSLTFGRERNRYFAPESDEEETA